MIVKEYKNIFTDTQIPIKGNEGVRIHNNINIPYNLYASVNRYGLLDLFKDYYLLKAYNPYGNYKKSGFIKLYSTITDITFSAAYKRVQRLLAEGWLVESGGNYRLISQTDFWSYFLDVQKLGHKEAFFKIHISPLHYTTIQNRDNIVSFLKDNFLPICQANEIRNLQLVKESNSKTKTGYLREKEDQLGSLPEKNKRLLISSKEAFFNENDFSLSQREIANLLGYNSSSMGNKVSKDLEARGYLGVEKRDFIFQVSPTESEIDYDANAERGILYDWVSFRFSYPSAAQFLHFNKIGLAFFAKNKVLQLNEEQKFRLPHFVRATSDNKSLYGPMKSLIKTTNLLQTPIISSPLFN